MRNVALVTMLLLAGCTKPSGNATTPESTPAHTTSSTASAAPHASTAAAPHASASSSAAANGGFEPPTTPAPAPDKIATSKGDLVIHPIYHATMWLEFGGKNIVLDPWSNAKARLDGVPKADYVFITDVHFDHDDPAGLAKVKKDGTTIVAPQAVVDKEKMTGVTVMKNGDKKDFGTFSVEAIPMYNLKRGPEAGKLFHDKGRGNGYVFTFGDKRVYVSGDTECTPEMKALKNIDVAFVCMNLPYTMPPSEAAECIDAFKPKIVYPFHDKGSNVGELKEALAKDKGIEVRERNWY